MLKLLYDKFVDIKLKHNKNIIIKGKGEVILR